MTCKLVRAEWLIQNGIVDNRQKIYRLIEHEGFPAPIQLSARTVAWNHDEVIEWLNARPRVEYKSVA